ncbi:DUF2334 domain-containing protein [Paraclostridium sordellii]|uniref:DUF2334 domain-containing protein n=1 Tax=Paraclostridium sordellii TaxID=1505 RepID=UPI0005E46934|nr:DUF2334 domain-containing protein [Paeniclostridium sordellii]CEQ26856.1 cell wall anchored protein [[Clostridium] sordellii] [Paeniclostridium sordellii]
MMFKRKVIISIIFTLSVITLSSNLIYADDSINKKTLIVYETKTNLKSNINTVNHLNELLYVFNKEVKSININDYKKGDLNNYDYLFVININNNIDNKMFMEDFVSTNKNIYWIGDKIENLLEYKNNKFQIKYIGKNNNITNLDYGDKNIILENKNNYNLVKTSTKSKVISTMSDGYNTYPFILKEKNLYYISNWDMYESYIFEDTLNDFFEKNSFVENKIFVEIEDVNPFSDTVKLEEISNYLYEENIPFIISLTPTSIEKNSNKLIMIDDKLIDTIKYMQEKGGSVILNGYSHNIKDESKQIDYEFYNEKVLNSRNKDLNIYIKDRLLSGIRICIENDIYPLGFESQKNAMTQEGYKEIKKYISTYIGRYKNNNDIFEISTFPYIINDSEKINIIIPENLGQLSSEDKLSLDKIKYNYYKLSMVRGYTGGFYFNPNIDINYLKKCIDYFKSENLSFLDLKKNINYINIDDIKIKSNNNNIESSYDKSKSITKAENNKTFNKLIKNINNIVIKFVIVVLVIFITIFIIFKIINRQKFIRR